MNNLDLILKVMESGEDLSPNLKLWLCGAIKKFKYGLPIDRAFEVSIPSKKEQRNNLIRTYANSIDAECSWTKAEIILSELRKLKGGRHCSPIIQEADNLYPVPKSQRQIFRIITDNQS